MAKGGKREGAGRPRLEATKLREALYRIAEANADVLAKALFEKAKGGDVPALRELLDRVLGRAKEHIDLTSDGQKLSTFAFSPAVAAAMRKVDEEIEKQLRGEQT